MSVQHMKISTNLEHLPIFSALASESRLKIINLLRARPMNVSELSIEMGISQAITTRHVKMLVNAGLVVTHTRPASRGTQKVCSLAVDRVMFDLKGHGPVVKNEEAQDHHAYTCTMPVGHYTQYDVTTTCGLVSTEQIIGMIDDPRYFASPDHVEANMLWFGSGWVEYLIPNYLLSNQRAKQLVISMEICSEAPGYNEQWPSDISFIINNHPVGMWTSPGDFGEQRGRLTPSWYDMGSQYGNLKTIMVDRRGAFIDGIKVSDTTIKALEIQAGKPIKLRIANLTDAKHVGGISLFGEGFGNYNQDIAIKLLYDI